MTDSFFVCKNRDEFLFFSRTTGKPVSKVSRRGNGPGEYNLPVISVYSEAKDELFILDYPVAIKVYGRDGTFKRELPFNGDLYPNGTNALYDYDEERLLFNVFSFGGHMQDTSFIFISKHDGSPEGLRIPYKERVDLIFVQGAGVTIAEAYFAVRNGKDYLLTEYSSDTVYRFTPEHELIPVLVRTPSIQKMEAKVLLHSWLETGKYLFFSTEKPDWDRNASKGFQTKGYLMEKRSGEFFQTNVRMDDYKGREVILGPSVIDKTRNPQTGVIALSASELHAANAENKLSGRLKEVTDRLTGDDEYVFMILRFK
jgi:hypothetical protein